MELLTAFQQTKNADVKQRLSELLGLFVDSEGKIQSYFDIYNHDLAVINQLLEHPPSETACYQKAYDLQESYNQTMDLAKQRWEKGNKTFDVGRILVKDLSLRKKLYQEGLENLKIFEERQAEIASFSNYKEPQKKTMPGSPWWELQTIAKEQDLADLDDIEGCLMSIAKKLDEADKGERAELLLQIIEMHVLDKKDDYKAWLFERADVLDIRQNKNRKEMLKELFEKFSGRVGRLNTLHETWLKQGALVQCSTDDLIKIKNEIDNFSSLMDMIEKEVPKRNLSAVDSTIKKQIDQNRHVLKEYRQQIEAAAIWRIKGASQYGNLRLDDALFVLKREISQNVFQFDTKEVLNKLSEVASTPIESITYGCNFANFNELHKLLMRSENTKVQQQWLSSRWATNKDKRNFIDVTVKSDAIIPTVLVDLVPDKASYFPPSNWLRYWFFRTNYLLTGFWGWVRKVWVGISNETVTLINETYRHVDTFEKSVRVNHEKGGGLNLLLIGQSSSFLDALEILPIIEAEKSRTKAMVTQGLMGAILKWTPFLKAYETSEFSKLWLKELDRAETAIKEKSKKIAKYIMEDFEWMLLDSIKNKSFILPGDLMSNLEKYITYYGSSDELKRLQQIASPIYVIRKFSFLMPPKENELFRLIDEDNVTSFLRYAEKYWTPEQVVAIKLIVGIITRSNVPKNTNEDMSVFMQVKCLLPEKDTLKAFNELMQMVANEFIFTTGDNGDDDCLHFLERFASDAARTWNAHRNDNLDEKFIFINNLLTLDSGEERDLNRSDAQEIGTTQFSFQNYERYIKDILIADREKKAKRMQLLHNQAKVYVDNYHGDNLQYVNLIFALGKEPGDQFVTDYCKKRILWLIKQENHNHQIEFNEDDSQFIACVKSSPRLISLLTKMVNEQVTSEFEHLSSFILEINDPELTATYFGKRFEKLVNNDQFAEILDEGDFYNQLLQNPIYAQKVYLCLRDKLSSCIKTGNWEAFSTDQLFNLFEKAGTLENKEAYRLLRIKQLLANNNSALTESYLIQISKYLGQNYLENKIFTLPAAKHLFVEIVKAHVAVLSQNQQWQGHAQYFIEFYLPKEQKELRHDIHLKWLTEFIKQPQKFTGSSFIERSTLDGKYHFQNKEIPNDSVSLTDFYGEVNLPKVRELIMERLDHFCEDLDDEIIQLINSYFRDPVFNRQEHWPLFRKKRDLFQQAQKTIHCLKNGIFAEGISQLENFHVQMIGSAALASMESGHLHQQITVYQQQLFTQILEVVRSSCKELLISSVAIEPDSIEFKETLSAERNQQKVLMSMLKNANLPDEFKQEVQALFQNRSVCIEKLKGFVANLNFEKLHLISFDIDDLLLFSQSLGKSAKQYLKIQVKALKDYLPADDPLAKALAAWYRVLKGKYSNTDLRRADIAVISEYRSAAKNFPQLAEDMAERLIKALEAHDELTYFPLFKDERVSYQNAFVQYLSPSTQRRLLNTIKAKMEWLLIHSDPTQAQFSRVDWSYHAKLVTAIAKSQIPNAIELNESVNIWVNSALLDVDVYLKSLLDDLDIRIQSKKGGEFLFDLDVRRDKNPSILEREQQLIKKALFVRSFGGFAQIKKLNQQLSEVARRQHRAMMQGGSDSLIDHSLDFADKLISTAGSYRQRMHCAQLVEKWNLYRMKPEDNELQDIRSLAVNDALPAYVGAFEESVYAYFVKKHKLPANFHVLMKEKMREWGLQEVLLEPERILKKHPLTEFLAILTPLAAKSSHGFLYRKPSDGDARKLFVGFCLTIQASQLVKLWQNRQSDHKQFNPGDISGPLSNLVKELMRKYDIGRGDFNKGLFKAIAKDKDYFASWSAIPENQPQSPAVTVKSKRA